MENEKGSVQLKNLEAENPRLGSLICRPLVMAFWLHHNISDAIPGWIMCKREMFHGETGGNEPGWGQICSCTIQSHDTLVTPEGALIHSKPS